MTFAAFISIACFCVLMGAGQILFKIAALRLDPAAGMASNLAATAISPYFWAAGVLYAAASALWVVILTRVPLSVAYPATTLTIILVPIVSWLMFNDPLNLRMIVGMMTILLGVWLIAGGQA